MSSEALISAVFSRLALWEQQDQNHHNRYKLDKLWEEVATEVKMARKDVRNKWKNLRDKFRVELQKQPKPRSGDGASGKDTDFNSDDENQQTESLDISSWQYFESLMFLRDQFTPRTSHGNLTSTTAATLPSSPDPATLNPNDALFDDTIPSPSTPRPSSSASTQSSISSRKRNIHQRNDDATNKLIELEEKKLKLLSEDKSDKDLSFFDCLIPHIKKLPDEKKMLLFMEIQQVVYRHVYGSSPYTFPFQGSSTLYHSNLVTESAVPNYSQQPTSQLLSPPRHGNSNSNITVTDQQHHHFPLGEISGQQKW